MDIVDRINSTNAQKEALKVIKTRLQAKDPHIGMNTLTVSFFCFYNLITIINDDSYFKAS